MARLIPQIDEIPLKIQFSNQSLSSQVRQKKFDYKVLHLVKGWIGGIRDKTTNPPYPSSLKGGNIFTYLQTHFL